MKLSFQITNILAKTKRKKKEAPDPGEGSDQQQIELFEHIWLKARLITTSFPGSLLSASMEAEKRDPGNEVGLIKQWKQYVLSNISKGTAFLHQVLRIVAFGNQSKVQACRNKLVMQ